MVTLRTPSAPDLLNAWERGLLQQPVQRALDLLGTAAPGTAIDILAQLSIGQRNGLLLNLRERAFGSQVMAVATCPGCGLQLDLDFAVSDIQAAPQPPLAEESAGGDGVFALRVDGCVVEFRLPTSLDLQAVAGLADIPSIRRQLLARCLMRVDQDGEALAIAQWPDEVIDAVNEEMERLDPLASLQLDLACPECEHRWLAAFDPGDYLWRELGDWAVRILRDVHSLASAYGWREADILAMHPWRRQVYLELLSGQGVA
jgi:hypothetical protein